MELLGIAGSLRQDSHSRRLLTATSGLLPPNVHFTEYARLELIPPFDEDDEVSPGLAVRQWRTAIAAVDGVLFVCQRP
jgi:NAD(P)H-dependent FMN reductase